MFIKVNQQTLKEMALPGMHVAHVDPGVAKVLEVLAASETPEHLVGAPIVIPKDNSFHNEK